MTDVNPDPGEAYGPDECPSCHHYESGWATHTCENCHTNVCGACGAYDCEKCGCDVCDNCVTIDGTCGGCS